MDKKNLWPVCTAACLAAALVFAGILTAPEITHDTTDVGKTLLMEQLLAGGAAVGIAEPPETEWYGHEAGRFSLGIANENMQSTETYFINVYLSGLGGEVQWDDIADWSQKANSWLSFPWSVSVGPGDAGTVDITLNPGKDTSIGTYKFTAAVCGEYEPGGCHLSSDNLGYARASDSLYGSAEFEIHILE